MAKSDEELHHECMNRFIELANTIKNEGTEIHVVSGGMTTAAAVYGTFVAAGNEGWLSEEGVDKMVASFRHQLEAVQKAREAQNKQKQQDQ